MSAPITLHPGCIKTLSAVEAVPQRSNQHEFNGVRELKEVFGPDQLSLTATFSVRGTSASDQANVTWYDARASHPTRSEYRLYFQSNRVMQEAKEGDNILVGYDSIGRLHVILIPMGSPGHVTVESWRAA